MSITFERKTFGWRIRKFGISVADLNHGQIRVESQEDDFEVKIIFIVISGTVAIASCLMLLVFALLMVLVLDFVNLSYRLYFESALVLLCSLILGLGLGYILERRGFKQFLARYKNSNSVLLNNKILASWTVGQSFVVDLLVWCAITMLCPGVFFKLMIYFSGWNSRDLAIGYLIVVVSSTASFFYWERVLGKNPYTD